MWAIYIHKSLDPYGCHKDCSSAHIDAHRNWACADVDQNVGVGYGMVILYSVCQFYHFPRLQELCWKLSEVREVQWRWQSLRGKQLGRSLSDREFGRSSSQQLKQATGVSILILFLLRIIYGFPVCRHRRVSFLKCLKCICTLLVHSCECPGKPYQQSPFRGLWLLHGLSYKTSFHSGGPQVEITIASHAPEILPCSVKRNLWNHDA